MPLKKQFNVGVIGGNFDPIHNGHLLIAQEARIHLDLARVLFCPYRQSPRENDRDITEAQTRLLMVELALKDIPPFQVNLVDMNREGPSYTVDTVQELNEKNPNWDLHFIIGSDNLKEFHQWKDPEGILDAARLFVARREASPKKVPREVKELIEEHGADRITFQDEDAPRFHVSSTMIRNRRREGQSIDFLVPDEVQDYIRDHNLYEKRKKL